MAIFLHEKLLFRDVVYFGQVGILPRQEPLFVDYQAQA
jgi:hypothetical protein